MNKKIIISLSVIGLVAAVAIGGTIAYFSDTETSTGNLFAAGSIDLKIDNECSLNGEPVTACTWTLKDLENELFFNFTDLVPGDEGEDTVSLHVYDNDAWACVTFKDLVSADNTCTEPESAVDPDGSTCDPNGELDDELNFVFWVDDGDNVLECRNETVLMQGPASDLLPGPVTYTLADADENNVGGNVGDPLVKSTTYYIGKAWCFGQMGVVASMTPAGCQITCNGQPVNNASQTDSLTGTIEFYAEQWRNNPNFQCGL